MKKIVVKHCHSCVFFIEGREEDNCCLDYEEEIIDKSVIPDWCPLDPKNVGPVTVELEKQEAADE